MAAFESRAIEAWSVWCGKQFLNKGWGSQDLQSFLEALLKGATNAVYTLKVYEDISKEDQVTKIKANTPDDGSFNFRLNGEEMAMTGAMVGTHNSTNARYSELERRMTALEEYLVNKAKEEEQEEPESIGSVLIDVLKDPSKVSKYVDVIQAILNPNRTPPMPNSPGQVVPMQAARVGNTETQSQEEKLNRLAAAIDSLEKSDPKLIEHLEKLAALAQKDPGQFSMLISLLEKF